MEKQGHFPERLGKHFAGAFAVLTIAGCGAPIPQTENPTLTPTSITRTSTQEVLPKTNEQVIQEEVKKLGIQVSGTEGKLWHDFGYSHSQEKKPINAITMQEAAVRVESTVLLMKQSENPYLNNAANYILPLLSSETVSIEIYDQIEKAGYSMTTNAYLATENSPLRYRIKIAGNEALNNSSAITLAFQLTHEIEHVKNMIEHQNSLSFDHSPQERLKEENERHDNPEKHLAEESKGYAMQARAYITAYGLGFRGGRGLNHETYAAEFIKGGSDPNSAYWENFIKRELIRIEKQNK